MIDILENLIVVDKDHVREAVNNVKMDGYRFVSMSCDKAGEDYEFTYHFDLNYEMKHIRILVKLDEPVKSISSIYAPALLVENEYQDLYGFKFEGLLIDYKGKLYLTEKSPKTPMKKEDK